MRKWCRVTIELLMFYNIVGKYFIYGWLKKQCIRMNNEIRNSNITKYIFLVVIVFYYTFSGVVPRTRLFNSKPVTVEWPVVIYALSFYFHINTSCTGYRSYRSRQKYLTNFEVKWDIQEVNQHFIFIPSK